MAKVALKKEGVVTLQTLAIFLICSIEYLIRSGFGIVSGLIILLSFILGSLFGRSGTAYAAAVNPPLAFGALAIIFSLAHNGVHVAKFAIDFIGSLASVSPWLLIGAVFAWYRFLRWRRANSI